MKLDEVMRIAISRAGVVRVRSALNPFLWTFVWSVVFVLAAYAFKTDPIATYGCLILAALPLLVALGVGIFFAARQPDRLQSEEFVIRQQELTMIEKKGGYLLPPVQVETDHASADRANSLEEPSS